MHIVNTRILKKMVFQEKKKGGTEEEERKSIFVFVFVFVSLFLFCFCFSFLFFSAIALAGIHIPGKSHTKLPTSTAASGCVQSVNHLHFQLKKKRIQTQLNSKH